jgi:hypothetical protein
VIEALRQPSQLQGGVVSKELKMKRFLTSVAVAASVAACSAAPSAPIEPVSYKLSAFGPKYNKMRFEVGEYVDTVEAIYDGGNTVDSVSPYFGCNDSNVMPWLWGMFFQNDPKYNIAAYQHCERLPVAQHWKVVQKATLSDNMPVIAGWTKEPAAVGEIYCLSAPEGFHITPVRQPKDIREGRDCLWAIL